MKKLKIVFIMVALGSLPFIANAGFVCFTSSNQEKNQGHCKEYSEGNDLCYPDGEGPPCYKSELILQRE